MRRERSAGAGLVLALLSSATFGTSGSFARSLIEAGWSAEAAVAARIGIASAVLAVPAALALRGKWHVLRRNLGVVAVFGLLAVAGAQVGFFNAVRYLPVGVALLLEYLGILLVVLWMWTVHGQRPRWLTGAGSAVAVLGLVFVLDLTGNGGGRIRPVGVLLGLCAAVGLAAFFVLSAHVDVELPAVALASGGMGLGAAVLILFGAVGTLPMHMTYGEVTFAGHRTSWLVPILGLSLVAAVFSYLTGIRAARILGARLSSFVGLTEVLFAVLVAWLLLGELPVPIQLLGGALVVAGVALVRVDEFRPVRVSSGPPDPPAVPALTGAAGSGPARG
jgi:drug/metabolite transporter (DMT)-like permease